MIYLYLFGTCFHFIYVFMIIGNNCALITCDSKSMPVGLMLPLYGNTTQNERFRKQLDAFFAFKETIMATNHSSKNQQSGIFLSLMYK